MQYVECPNRVEPLHPSLYLVGETVNCPDWQSTIVDLLRDQAITLFNPRRKEHPAGPLEREAQLQWENDYQSRADAILFWFSKETLCPTAIYSLGIWSLRTKILFVGIHPEFALKRDIEIQLSIVRPSLKVVFSHEHLVRQVVGWRNVRAQGEGEP